MTTKPQPTTEPNHEFWYTSVFPGSRQPLLKVGDKLEVVETKDDVLDLHYGNCFSAKLLLLPPMWNSRRAIHVHIRARAIGDNCMLCGDDLGPTDETDVNQGAR